MIYDRKELCKLLNITKDNLRMLEKRKTLDKKLESKGLKLIKVIKGPKTLYEAEKLIDKGSTALTTLNIRKKENFLKYFGIRTQEKANNVKDIAIKSNVNKNTVVRWDKKMLDNKVMSKDGFYYFKIDIGSNEVFEISKEEYKSYWRNVSFIKALKDLQDKYLNGLISLNEFQLASVNIGSYYNVVQGHTCFRIPKYKIDRENTLFLDLNMLLEGVNSYADD